MVRICRNIHRCTQEIAPDPILPGFGKTVTAKERYLFPLSLICETFFKCLPRAHRHGIVLCANSCNLSVARSRKPKPRTDSFMRAGFSPLRFHHSQLNGLGLGFEHPKVALLGSEALARSLDV